LKLFIVENKNQLINLKKFHVSCNGESQSRNNLSQISEEVDSNSSQTQTRPTQTQTQTQANLKTKPGARDQHQV
jgi:hypothetical protein